MTGANKIACCLFLGSALAAWTGCGPASNEAGPASASASADHAADQHAADQTVLVEPGTVLTITFDEPISTDSSSAGDRFDATVVEPVYVGQELAIDQGAKIHGRVVEVEPGKKIGGKAKLNLEFTGLELTDGDQMPINASFYAEGKSQAGKDAATIGGSTAGGAILGRIIGHQSDRDDQGTAIGAIVGAAIGTAIAASNEGQPVTIPAGSRLAIRLDSPLRITAA